MKAVWWDGAEVDHPERSPSTFSCLPGPDQGRRQGGALGGRGSDSVRRCRIQERQAVHLILGLGTPYNCSRQRRTDQRLQQGRSRDEGRWPSGADHSACLRRPRWDRGRNSGTKKPSSTWSIFSPSNSGPYSPIVLPMISFTISSVSPPIGRGGRRGRCSMPYSRM